MQLPLVSKLRVCRQAARLPCLHLLWGCLRCKVPYVTLVAAPKSVVVLLSAQADDICQTTPLRTLNVILAAAALVVVCKIYWKLHPQVSGAYCLCMVGSDSRSRLAGILPSQLNIIVGWHPA